MTPPELGLLLLSILTSVAGQFLLKTGALKLGKVNEGNWMTHVLGIPQTPELVVGLICYGLGAFAYILVLTRVSLSIVGPAAALTYVFSILLGYFVFGETIPISRLVGLGLIMAGVILVVWKK